MRIHSNILVLRDILSLESFRSSGKRAGRLDVKELLELIGLTIGASAEKLTTNSTSEDFPKWDSLRTVLLGVALEQTYEVTLPPQEVYSLTSVARIREVLKGHGVIFNDRDEERSL